MSTWPPVEEIAQVSQQFAAAGVKPPGIALVAPAGYVPDPVTLTQAVAYFTALGCVVKNLHDPAERHLRFGAGDAARAEQLWDAAQDPEIDIVMAVRGSYGISRLLATVDWRALAVTGKLWLGFSDVTALHCALMVQGAHGCVAGPAATSDFSAGDNTTNCATSRAANRALFWHTLLQPHTTVALADAPPHEITGRLWGGNLAIVASLVGTPYMPPHATAGDGVLFLEDIAEHPYRVERMLLHLHHAGILERQRALLLGEFSHYRLSEYDNGYDFECMLEFIRSRIDCPILTGLPFGHGERRCTLPLGATAHLDREGRLHLSGYRHLKAVN